MQQAIRSVAVVFAAALAGMQCALAAAPHADVGGGRFDFGKVAQGDKLSHEFVITNTGDETLQVSGAELSQPGMQVRFKPAAIAPGAQGTVTIDWSTDHVAGAIEGSALIRSNDPARPAPVLTLVGTVTPAISIEPIPAVYLSAFANESAERVLTLRNNTDRAFEVSGAEAGPHTTVSVAALEAGKVYAIKVRPKANEPTGRFEESLAVQTSNGTITLPVHVWIKPDLYANPDSVDFGAVARETAQQPGAVEALAQTAIIRRRSGTFHIKSIASDIPMVSVSQSPQEGANDSFTITLRLRPEALFAGARIDGKVRVRTDDPHYPEIVIPVTGSVTSATGAAAMPEGPERG